MHHQLGMGFIRHRPGCDHHRAMLLFNFLGDPVEFFFASTGDHHRCTFLCKRFGDRLADPGIPPRHEGNLSTKSLHDLSSSSWSSSSESIVNRSDTVVRPGSTFLATVMNPEWATIR